VQRERVYTPTINEPTTQEDNNGYFLINEEGKIIFANQAAVLLKNVTVPTYIRDFFQLCLPAFEAAFASCLAKGKSQSRLVFQAGGGPRVAVEAHFELNPLPANAFQVMITLKPVAAAGSPLPPDTAGPAGADRFWQLDAAFIKAQTLAQIGNFKFDYLTAQLEWTPATFQIFRLPETAPALTYPEFLERIHPGDRPLFLRRSHQATRMRSSLQMDLRILRGDHTTGFIQLTTQPAYNEAGEVSGAFGTVVDITPYKDAECQLRQALTTVEKVMNYSPEMLLSIDELGIILHANKACEMTLGFSAAEVIGQHYGQFIDSEDLNRTIEELTRVNAGFPTHNFQNYCMRKDGSRVPIYWSAYWSAEEQNYFCVGRDGTQLWEAQQQLIASEERFRLLAENGSDMMCLLSPAGEYNFVSSSTTRILGYAPEVFAGKTPFDFIHPQDLPQIRECFRQIFHTDHLTFPPYRYRAGNGEWRWMETIITNYLDHPFIQGFTTTCRDITERRERELKIQESEQRYKSLFEHHPDPVYSLSLEGKFMTANQRVGQILGYGPGDIIGKDFREVIVPAQLAHTMDHFNLCRQGYARTYKTAVYDRNGTRIYLEVNNIPIIIDGQVTGIYGIAKDITQFKKARKERRKLIERLEQKNHNLEQFAYIVSHNLRAPVANILGLTSLFNNLAPATEMNGQVIANLQKSADHLDAIIHGLNQILSNRFELNQPREMVDLATLLACIQNILKEDLIRSQALIEADFTEVAAIKTIKSFLHNVLLSLIRNAIQHQNPEQPLAIKIKTSRFENKNCLTIQDNSLNLKRQKNDPWAGFVRFRTSEEEKGMPWQLIKSQIEALGGKIELDTTPGTGSTFKLFLTN
jgi:PAS domain S-box-containing protein